MLPEQHYRLNGIITQKAAKSVISAPAKSKPGRVLFLDGNNAPPAGKKKHFAMYSI